MDEQMQLKMAFEFANDLSKQLIALSTGMMALMITFRKEVLADSSPRSGRWLKRSWVCLILSIAAGVVHMMYLTGTLASGKALILGFHPKLLAAAVIQVGSFAAGVVLILLYGVGARPRDAKPEAADGSAAG